MSAALLACLLCLPGCLSCMLIGWQSEVELAADFMVTAAWQEIIPSEPLIPEKSVQYIAMQVNEGDVAGTPNGMDWRKLKLRDGRVIMPDLELYDMKGKGYRLKVGMMSARRVGFVPLSGHFPRDGRFVRLKIRSDEPFRCTITWFCLRPI